MGELEEKISALLSSPEGMEQVLSVARSLSGNSGDLPLPKNDAPAPETQKSNTSDAPVPSSIPGLGNIDPAMMSSIMQLLNEYNSGDDRKTALLQALKPYVKQERQEKLDKAVRIARLARVAKSALSNFNGGNKNV